MISKHEFYLLELCEFNQLRKININPQDVVLIIIEPYFYENGNAVEAPDILILTKYSHWFVIELKGCKRKRAKALRQINSGFNYLEQKLGIKRGQMSGKFVIYHHRQGYIYENIGSGVQVQHPLS